MKQNKVPITERSNPRSVKIDTASVGKILKIISECDGEIFNGYGSSGGVYNSDLIERCVVYARSIQKEIQKHGRTNLVLVGAGTSGRLCRLMAQVLTTLVKDKITIIPIIAGGIKALVRAEPNTEDKVKEGVSDYLCYTKDIDRSKCFVVGVSCGLSASYVKGALDCANKYSDGKTAIIGFNPLELATIDLTEKIKVLNPIIGPEPIVGSVRMKGGTTTMVLIYSLVVSSLATRQKTEEVFIKTLNECEDTLSKVSGVRDVVKELVICGNKAMRSGGSIYFIGSSHYGALCIYDAAECPPTFGAKIDQVNGFSEKGVADLVYYPYEGDEKMAKVISLKIFLRDVFPKLTEKDMVVVMQNTNENLDCVDKIIHLKVQKYFLLNIFSGKMRNNKKQSNNTIFINITKNSFQKMLFIRSLLVQISTGSFILSGKIYGNKMIDLRITNKKLFLRAIRIIHQITQIDNKKIEKALLKTIHDGENFSGYTLEDNVELAATKENIVPITILSLIYPEKGYKEIKLILKKEPIIRKLVVRELQNFN